MLRVSHFAAAISFDLRKLGRKFRFHERHFFDRKRANVPSGFGSVISVLPSTPGVTLNSFGARSRRERNSGPSTLNALNLLG